MHTGFRVELSHDRTAYLIADKGIEKRIQKILWKKYGLASNVIYELIPSDNIYLDGSLRIKIVDDKCKSSMKCEKSGIKVIRNELRDLNNFMKGV